MPTYLSILPLSLPFKSAAPRALRAEAGVAAGLRREAREPAARPLRGAPAREGLAEAADVVGDVRGRPATRVRRGGFAAPQSPSIGVILWKFP